MPAQPYRTWAGLRAAGPFFGVHPIPHHFGKDQ